MTVEAALAIGCFVAVFAFAVSGVMVTVDYLRCIDAAREAARLFARDDRVLAREAATRIAPSDARVEIATDGDRISVVISAAPVALFPDLVVTGEAFAVAEPTAAP